MVQPPNKCDAFNHKLRVNRIKGVFFAKLACITIITWSGCISDQAKIAIRTNNYEKGEAAIAKLTDQGLLVKVASEARNFNIRAKAIEKLADQTLLAKIALEDQDQNIRVAAIEKLTDQTLLVKIALEDQESTGRAAIKKLTDYVLLTKIAMEDPHQWDRETSVLNLMNTVMFDKIAVENEDSRVQLIYKVICAFENVPQAHRARLIGNILPAIRVLFDPEVVDEVGEIVSVETTWEDRSQNYASTSTSDKGQMPGEYFNCSIALKNEELHLCHSWETNFPDIAYYHIGFRAADVNADDLLEPIFEQLTQTTLAKIVLEDKDPNIRSSIVEKLTDPALLAKIADEDKDQFVRISAQAKFDEDSISKADSI